MGWFRRNKTNNQNLTPYQEEKLSSYYSGGNMYDSDVELEALGEKANISLSGYSGNMKDIDDLINSTIKPLSYLDYYLLKQWCMYFTNLFRWETNDPDLDEKIKLMLYYGFFVGESALYFNPVSHRWDVVMISRKDRGFYGTLRSVSYYYNPTFDNENWKEPQEIFTSTEVQRFVFYKFRTDALSCWVWLWPAVRIQNLLLSQINVANLISNKQIIFKVTNSNDSKKELENFINPLRFWTYGRDGISLGESIKRLTDKEDLTVSEKYLEIYRQTTDIYHDLFGYRNNSDYKKERNVTGEVNASQSTFNNIQNEYYFNFDVFCRKLQGNMYFTGIIKNLKKEGEDDTISSNNARDID